MSQPFPSLFLCDFLRRFVVFICGALVPVQGLKDAWTGYFSGSDTNVAAFRMEVKVG